MTMVFGIPSLALPGGNRLVARLHELCGASGSITTEALAGSLNRSTETVDRALKLAERMGLVERDGQRWRPIRAYADLDVRAVPAGAGAAPVAAAVPAPRSLVDSFDSECHAELGALVVTCLYFGRPVPTEAVARALGCDEVRAEAVLRRALHAGVIDYFFDEGWLPVRK